MRAIPSRVVAAAACALALAGCGAGEDIRGGGTIPGGSTTIALLLPLSGPDERAVRDMIAGAKLALHDAGGRIGEMRVGMAVYDESAGPAQAVARTAIEDVQIGAVIGGLRSGDAAREIPITDAAGILQVSPGALDPALLTTPELHPSGKQRFFALAPDAAEQARAMLEAAGPGPVAIERDSGRDARVLATALRAAAGGRLDADAGTILYAGVDADTAAAVADSLRSGQRVVFGDAIARTGLADRLTGRSGERATFVAAVPRRAPEPFAGAFEDRFARAPGPYAWLGHEAMRRVLGAIRAAAPRSTYRQRIVDAYASAAQPLPAEVWP
jgi:ABC-type branched-subunit amino acid transport system substrate-binding protein